MKISSTVSPVGNTAVGGRSRPAAGATERTAPNADNTEVSVSGRLNEIQAAITAEPVVDTKRVNEIKQAIAEGRFKISPERIADGLLTSVRDMLAKDRQA